MTQKDKKTSLDIFMNSNSYKKAIYAENSDEHCKDCSFMFVFNGQTRCYAYEQQSCNSKDIIFHPQEDYNCTLFSEDDVCAYEIEHFIKALKKGVDPHTDDEYCKALKEANDYAELLYNMEKENKKCNDDNEGDDPNTYAHCYDWEDEPENCMCCADDDCPLNKG